MMAVSSRLAEMRKTVLQMLGSSSVTYVKYFRPYFMSA